MRIPLYRAEPGRYILSTLCVGEGELVRNGALIKYQGVDASRRGFGGVIHGFVKQGDTIMLRFGSAKVKFVEVKFQVMWAESHLGIEGKFRVGLTPIDPEVSVEAILRELDLVDDSMPVAS